MNAELLKRKIYWEVRYAIDKYFQTGKPDITGICQDMEGLLSGAEECQKLIESKSDISELEFYNMLTTFAFVTNWTEKDLVNIIEIHTGKNFVGSTRIRTRMHKVVKERKDNKHCACWYNEVGIDYRVLYTSDAHLDNKHLYTVEEISKLIADGKIVIVKEINRKLFGKKQERETYYPFECAYDDNSALYSFLSKDGKYYLSTLKYIKEQMTSSKLKKLFIENMKHIDGEISYVSNGGKFNGLSWDYVAQECEREFEEKGYTRRLLNLNTEKAKYSKNHS